MFLCIYFAKTTKVNQITKESPTAPERTDYVTQLANQNKGAVWPFQM